MSKLFIFGDSFSIGSEEVLRLKKFSNGKANFEDTTQWSTILADKLNVTDVANFAIMGCSNEYIFSIFHDCLVKNLISKYDYIIFQTTSKYRHWFFEEHPRYTSVQTVIDKDILSNEQVNALKKYTSYLQNDSLDTHIFTFLIYGLIYFKTLFPNLLLLSGWHDSPDCIGNLTNVDFNEFAHPDLKQKFLDKNDRLDSRINHLNQLNHEILADKIFKFFIRKERIDLTKDFKTGIYNV